MKEEKREKSQKLDKEPRSSAAGGKTDYPTRLWSTGSLAHRVVANIYDNSPE